MQGAIGHQGGAAGIGQGQPIPLLGNGRRRLTLHLAGQHQQVLPHQGQLRACNGTCGDSQRGLGTPASCSPPPPLSFEPLLAWVRGGEAGLDFGAPWGSTRGGPGSPVQGAWPPLSGWAAAIEGLFQLDPGDREGAGRAQWRGQGPRRGHCAPQGPMASSPPPPLAHLPICLQGQLPGTPGSLFPLLRSQPLSGGGAHLHIHSLTYSVTLRLKAQPHRPGHCFHPRTVLSQQTLTWRHPYRLQNSQMPKHRMADTNVTGLEMQAQSCEPTCTDRPTQTPRDATIQPSRLSRNLPSRWAGKWQPLRGKTHRPRGQPASDISWSLPLQDPLLPQPLLTCVPSALLPPGTPRLQPKSLLSQTLPSPSSFPKVRACPPTSLPALCSHRLGVPHLPPLFCPWLSHPNVLPFILPPSCLTRLAFLLLSPTALLFLLLPCSACRPQPSPQPWSSSSSSSPGPMSPQVWPSQSWVVPQAALICLQPGVPWAVGTPHAGT